MSSHNKFIKKFSNAMWLPMIIYSYLSSKYNYCQLTINSIFYNEFISTSYWIDIFLEPMFWIVDHSTKILGPVLVMFVIVLTTFIVCIAYIIGLPYYWSNYPNLTVLLMIYGHYLLINVVFYYYKGVITDPGTPPKGILISEAVSVCKKCIAPKPPRTHHCSVCNCCVLKMDHHCPWMNNCIGYYNHRYFFMYMVYMILGILFIMVFGFEIVYIEIWLGGDTGLGWRNSFLIFFGLKEKNDDTLDLHEGIPGKSNGTHFFPSLGGSTGAPELIEEHSNDSFENLHEPADWYRFSIIFAATLITGALFALLTLVIWHGRQISCAETSIEAHINVKETERFKKMSKVYKNPYNHGLKKNWQRFFGLTDRQSFWRVMLPSARKPIGNGLTWNNSFHDKVV